MKLLSSRDLWRLLLQAQQGYYYRVSQYKQFLVVQKLACWLYSTNEIYLYIQYVCKGIYYLFWKYELFYFINTGIKIVVSEISAYRTDNLRDMF